MENFDFDFKNLDVASCKYDDRYLVYSNGMLYNSKYEKFIIPSTNGKRSPYVSYNFYPEGQKGKEKKIYIHRLVAEHFIPNPKNLRDVHHIDSNPRNNHVSNLQWLSHKDNCKLKIFPRPEEIIKKKSNAFIYRMSAKPSLPYYVFHYTGKYAPPCRIYLGKDLDTAKTYRDKYFKAHRAVA